MSTINVNKIKARMVELGMTQKDVADKMGMAASSLNNKLQLKTEFTASEILKMSEVLRISRKKDEYFFVKNSE